EVHALEHGQPYYMGVFLTGTYQEILGDLHNLFGDTDAVHVSLTGNTTGNTYQIDHVVEGDDVKEVLQYVEYYRADLLERVRKATESSILKGTISRYEARLLLEHYERGLSSYTYLTEESAMPFMPQKKELSNGANGRGADLPVHQQELSPPQRGHS